MFYMQFSVAYLEIGYIDPVLDRTNRELMLECAVYGYFPTEVWWTKNGSYLNGTNTYFKSENRTLVIVDPQLRDNGIYYCHAKNKWSYVNRSFTLELLCKFSNVAY